MANQIPLPLDPAHPPQRLVMADNLLPVLDQLGQPMLWPYRTAILTGPARAGKSLLGQWFAGAGLGRVLDDADQLDQTALFHAWNRAQDEGQALLLISTRPPGEWAITLPDLASRLGAALLIAVPAPDDALMAGLIEAHAARRGLVLGPAERDFLLARIERSHAAAEAMVTRLDRLSLARKGPVTMALVREALEG